ncbi:MAG TPA: thiamine-phosphate kinase [Candidatus Angelobacter sp.]|nr:thiamine-phosphate kinase [Candidatus Angelobacter sp.]
MQERQLIKRIRALADSTAGSSSVVRGIGDDCAVLELPRGKQLLVTTDFCVEDIHFRRKWHPAHSVGHRCLARGLSDIASMGSTPMACFLSLGLAPKLPQAWIDGFLRGLRDLARRFHTQLAGGDISSAPKIIADIVVIGHAPSGKAVLRSGARPGDHIYVTGSLGGSAATLQQLRAGKRIKATRSNSHFYPQPRIQIGQWLQKRGLATAMIDLSDGLSVDLAHICEESRVSATICAEQIPIAKGSNLRQALQGGEDYELLFTASKRAKLPAQIAGVPITRIGTISDTSNYSSAIQILYENGTVRSLPQQGWEHFRR